MTMTAERRNAIYHRRFLAGSQSCPPLMAHHFTNAEMAVLAVIVEEVRERGDCRLFLKTIIERSHCNRSTVRRALNHAHDLGFITIEHVPKKGRQNLPNVIRIAYSVWHIWIFGGPDRFLDTLNNIVERSEFFRELSSKGSEGAAVLEEMIMDARKYLDEMNSYSDDDTMFY